MNIIKNFEKGEREVYCGAIGMISPQETIFSVPIRILQRHQNEKVFKYRVGGAIVWDSDIQEEWEETLTKTKFLNDDFQIVETIKVENGKLLYEQEHIERMKKSAEYFGFKFEKSYKSYLQEKGINGAFILRILLNKEGKITAEYKQLIAAKTNKIAISPITVNSQNEFMYHKTTYRPWFSESYEKIAKGEIYDEIFFNEKGELTEGARSNIILQIGEKFYTPSVSCGLLDGIYKKQMNNLTEKILLKSDLLKAEKIFCVNSVRGMVEVQL